MPSTLLLAVPYLALAQVVLFLTASYLTHVLKIVVLIKIVMMHGLACRLCATHRCTVTLLDVLEHA